MKKWLCRLLLLKVIILLLAGGFWLINKSREEEARLAAREAEAKSAERQERNRVNEFEKQLAEAATVEELQSLEKALERLPAKDRERLTPRLKLTLAGYHFDRAEENIFRAQSILVATGDKDNPMAQNYIARAMRDYREARKKIDELDKLADDSEYNFHFFYARGNIYYRYLVLIAEESEMQDVFNQTVLSWREALACREKDIDTEINLEILRKNQGVILKNATQGCQERMKMLPHQGVGLGRPRGVH